MVRKMLPIFNERLNQESASRVGQVLMFHELICELLKERISVQLFEELGDEEVGPEIDNTVTKSNKLEYLNLLHLALCWDIELHKEIKEFNALRNKVAHELLKKNLSDPELDEISVKGLKIIDQLMTGLNLDQEPFEN